MIPIVQIRPNTDSPEPPGGMRINYGIKKAHNHGPFHTPAFLYNAHTFWLYEYIDNRNAFVLRGYDKDGNFKKQWNLPNLRYLYDITLNMDTFRIVFHGQGPHGDSTYDTPWSEFHLE